jgi:methylenetetrahydrofolate reductase (NADPH)
MASTDRFSGVASERVARLLAAPRYEVIPVRGIADKLGGLPGGSRVAVTASPAHGQARTIEVAETLAAEGYEVIAHLSAKMTSGRRELAAFVERLAAAGVREAFVVGGDASPPAGPYHEAGDLLDELAGLDHPFVRIGIGGYPEGHPMASDEMLLEALRRKQPHASYIVTQMCFDAGVLVEWMADIRSQGIGLPVVIGLPGVVERRRLAEISLRTGVGASLRYIRKNRRQLVTLIRSRHYDPTALTRAVSRQLDAAGLSAAGAHLFTFNQVDATSTWVRSLTGG